MNIPLENLEQWELEQAIVAVSKTDRVGQLRFIRVVLRQARLEAARMFIANGAQIPAELLEDTFHPLPRGSAEIGKTL